MWGLTRDTNENLLATISELNLAFPFATDPSGHLAQALPEGRECVRCSAYCGRYLATVNSM